MEKYYEIAGIRIRVSGEVPDADGILSGFEAEPGHFEHSLKLQLTDSLDAPKGNCIHHSPAIRVYSNGTTVQRYVGAVSESWEKAHMLISRRGSESLVSLKRSSYINGVGPKTVLNSMEAEHLLTRREGFILHASVVAHSGKAILFTAPSGTGKSTQAALWESLRGAEIINGDRAAVRIYPDGIKVWGLPFAGSSDVRKNTVLPLAAIVYLGQEPQTRIERMSPGRAFRRIWEGVSVNAWDREDVALCSETVQNVAEHIPVYYLGCTPDESAVSALEEAMER